MRGRLLKGHRSKLQTDYASHECRNYFFEQCQKAGIDVRKQSEVIANATSASAASPR